MAAMKSKFSLSKVLLIICIIFAVIFFSIFLYLYSTEKKPLTNNYNELTLKQAPHTDYQKERQRLLQATTITMQYRGEITPIDNQLTKTYIISTLKNEALFTPLSGKVALPSNEQLVFHLDEDRVIIDIATTKEEPLVINHAYVLYRGQTLGAEITFFPDFTNFLAQLLAKKYPAAVTTTATSSISATRPNLVSHHNDALANYLDKLRLKEINVPTSWTSQLLVNETSRLNSLADVAAKTVFLLQPQDGGHFYLEYAPYQWIGKAALGPQLNFPADIYGQLVATSSSQVNNRIDIAGVKGKIFHQLTTVSSEENHLTTTAVFPFYYYYLAVTCDYGKLTDANSHLLELLEQNHPPEEYQATFNQFEQLVASLRFSDRQ